MNRFKTSICGFILAFMWFILSYAILQVFNITAVLILNAVFVSLLGNALGGALNRERCLKDENNFLKSSNFNLAAQLMKKMKNEERND